MTDMCVLLLIEVDLGCEGGGEWGCGGCGGDIERIPCVGGMGALIGQWRLIS